MKYLTFVLIFICFVSCGGTNNICNPREAKRIMENFTREYTGLDTLIRIDGYYYHEESIRFSYEDREGLKIAPLILSRNGEFKNYGYFKTREELHNTISLKPCNGSYTLSGDTIKARWALRYDLGSYEIYSEKYLIVNDSTLKRIWYLCETCDDDHNPVRNEIYKFYKYPVDADDNSNNICNLRETK